MEADISTWHKTGHFYFALTRASTNLRYRGLLLVASHLTRQTA
jgi:hypothetical protein